jgi:hypothetical protein
MFRQILGTTHTFTGAQARRILVDTMFFRLGQMASQVPLTMTGASQI